MPHSTNIISSIKLPNGTTYEIHDAQAIHKIEDLGLSAALIFKGTKATDAEILAIDLANVGEVWLATGSNTEYVCVAEINGTANAAAWEKLGNVHDAASSTHTHGVTVAGTNEASAVTGTVTVPTVSKTQKYMTAEAAAPAVTPTTDAVLGVNTQFTVSGGEATTTKLAATASGVAVGANGTANAITGFGAHTTAAAITDLNTTTIKNPTVTNVSIPNVTGNDSVTASKVSSTAGTAASWSASVIDGILSFDWTANTPTEVTASDVTASKVTLGDALSASSVATDDVTVATGSKSTAAAITALGTPTTAAALTGVKVTAQPVVTIEAGATGDVTVATGVGAISVSASGDNVDALTGVGVAAPAITLTNNASNVTGAVPVVSSVEIGTAPASLANGIAAAQKWTQSSGSTGTPQ